MGSGLHAETGCRKDYFGKMFEIPWKRSRQLGMVVAENMPTASFLTKIGNMLLVSQQGVGCAE